MKKFTITSLLTLFLVSFGFAEHVSVTSAQRAAQNFLKSFSVESVELVDVTADAKFANLYVFTSEHGFVVMSADNRVRPILGYSLSNSFVAEDMPENIRAWFQGYSDQIQYVIDNQLRAPSEVSQQWESLLNGNKDLPRTTTVVAPLLRTQWGQSAPYNNLCPADADGPNGHALTGCAATAMAQLMNYWEHPVRGTGYHSYTHSTYGVLSANFGNTVYDWDHMLNTYSGNYSNGEALAVATLMYHCGVSRNMNYGPTDSGAGFSVEPFIDYFDYSSDMTLAYKSDYSDAEWISMLKNELDNERPVFYAGNGPHGGHGFVFDGYDDNDDFHINWGWVGSCDGFYTIGILNPDSYPNGFNVNNAAVINCHPNTPPIDPPTISATVNGGEVILTWNSVSDAASYKVYRNDDLIASGVTGTSYTDSEPPYGDHTYYVKSVKSDGTMSLKSNKVTVNVHFAGPVPANLQASTEGNSVHLTWTAPESRNEILQYGTGNYVSCLGSGDGFYWAQRYPVDALGEYAGMAVNKVSHYFRLAGGYTLYLYSGNEVGPVNLLDQVSFTAPSWSWYDIELSEPVMLDYSSDLWVVMYASPGLQYPACFSSYSDSGVENACYYSSSGSYWSRYGNGTCSWMMKTYITDGAFTYNIYRNDVNIAANVTEASYDDKGLDFGIYTYYVTTNYFGDESDASNAVTVMAGDYTNDYVDLGLPSGTLWATCNVGANTPMDYGDYFAWGETQLKDTYGWNNYQYCNGSENTLTKYCSHSNYGNNGFTDGLTLLLAEDDAAMANMGEDWRIPTREEWTELYQNTTVVWTTINGVRGKLFLSTNGNSLFLPAAGYRGGSLYDAGSCGSYWSSSLYIDKPSRVWCLYFNSDCQVGNYDRNCGRSVRAVRTVTQNTSFVVNATPNPVDGGTVSGGSTYNEGATCTLVAIANTGYSFSNWKENGNVVSTDATYSFTVTGNRTLVANFSLNSYDISVSANPADGGTVTGGGTFSHGSTCTLIATTNTGYTFVNWTKNGSQVSTNPTYTFTVADGGTYVANFSLNNYSVFVSANPSVGGTVSGGGTYSHGSSCTLTATANAGYTFSNWTENGNVVSTNSNYNFTVTGDRTLVANFTAIPENYNISVSASPSSGGTVSGAGTYQEGSTCILTATPATGYSFVRWTKNGTQVSTNPSYSFTVTENASYVAVFSPNSYTVSVSANPSVGGTVSGGGTYSYGSSCTLTATANAGYTFVSWTENGMVSTAATYGFTVTGNRTLVANFVSTETNVTEGALNGLFSVDENITVRFSQGNLQYIGSAGNGDANNIGAYWKFAEHQWDYLGDNGQGSDPKTVDRDLFGWGTSGYNHGAVCYQPWSTSLTNSDYYAYGSDTYNLFDQTGQADWGYNAISNGGNQENSGWRTLTQSEWSYIFNTRSTTSGIRFAKANVNGVNGVILLPEDWSTSYYALNNTNSSSASFNSNTITVEQWNAMEQFGAVFLPAAGNRDGTSVGSYGGYWSASYYGGDYARGVGFVDSNLYTFVRYRSSGLSVRLARNYSFVINATPNPAEGGTVSGAGVYTEGTECTLTATANEGYAFVIWTENGEVVSTEAVYSFTVTGNRTLVANFASTGTNVTEGVLNGLFSVGENTTVRFSQGNLQYIGSAGTPYWKFADNQWDILGSTTGQGSSGQNIDRDLFGWGTSGYNHGANCYQPWSTSTSSSDYYAYGSDTYNLFDQTGQADWGYNAISNGGNQENSDWRTLTHDEWWYVLHTRNTASGICFAMANVNNVNGVILLPDDWSTSYYTLNNTNSGSASFNSNVITVEQWNTMEQHGAVFLPAAGDRFGTSVYGVGSSGYYWSASYEYITHGAEYVGFNDSHLHTGSIPDRDGGFSVRLARVASSFVINAVPNPAEGGAVSGAGAYAEGVGCTLTATANTGYNFVRWTKNGSQVSTNSTYSFTVTENASYVAVFSPNSYTITASASPSNGGSVSGAGTCNYGSTCTLTATPATGYNFVRWTKNGQQVSTNPTYSVTVTEDASYVAVFGLNSYTVSASANPSSGGSVSGGGTYNYGSYCTLKATPATYYNFVRWTKNGSQVSTNPRYTFRVTENANYEAVFNIDSYTISTSVSPSNGGTVSGAGTYTNGSSCTLTATPATGYIFVRWTKNGSQVSTNSTYSFTVTESASYVAVFGLNSYTVSASANPSEGGTVSGGGTYNYGSYCTLTATPATGYSFVRWTKNGSQVSTNPRYTFRVTTDANCEAVFEQSAVTQTQTLSNGWNWWSSYVEQNGSEGLAQLENSLGSAGQMIKSRSDGYVESYTYNGTTDWFGSLTSISNEQMYKINMNNSYSAAVTGYLVSTSNHPITIGNGWNWIGFPLNHSVGVAEALSSFSPTIGDILKGRNGYATYYSSDGMIGWFGSLNTLEPGCGYMYHSQSSGTKTLVFQPGRGEVMVANVTPEDNVYRPDDKSFADNMTVTAVVETEGEELRSDSYELAAFADGECRGSVRLLYVEPIDRYVAFLTVFGETGDALEFRLTDGTETLVSADMITFVSDGVMGTLASPKVLHFGMLGVIETMSLVRIYPNPVRAKETLNIALPEASGRLTVEIGNVLGVTVFKGEVTVDPTFVARITLPDVVSPGTYVMKAIQADGTVYYGKLIVE